MRAAPLLGLAALLALGCDDAGPDPVDGAPPTRDAGAVDAAIADAAIADAATSDAARPDAAGSDASTDGGPCTAFASGEEVGRLGSPDLNELSGLAASRVTAGLLYANNDSGDVARVFLLGTDGAHLGTVSLNGARHVDYEDVAVGPGPDGLSWVYVGDVGDNAARRGGGTPRAEIVVYRFAEPTVDVGAAPLALEATPEAITLTYPDAPHDCESVAVDPDTGDLYLLTKEDTGPSTLYRRAAPLTDGVLEVVGSFTPSPGSINATAMDLSPDGRGLLVRTYNRIHLLLRGPGESWADSLARGGLSLPQRSEGQGEAIAWQPDGRGYYTASEGAAPPLYHFVTTDPGCGGG